MKKRYLFIIVLIIYFIFPFTAFAENIPAKITSEFLNVRSGAGTKYDLQGSLIFGTDVTIVDYNASKTWAKIVFDSGKEGWVSSSYLLKINEVVATDEAYCNQLVSAGFDSTYCPYLTYLHQKHPTWTFTPLVTNLEWSSVLDGEEGLNYVQSTNDAYRANDTLMEAPGWYTANQTVNAYFLDPRNFLSEEFIFMFEDLSYNSTYHNLETVREIVSGTRYSEYAEFIMNAGTTYKVSPVHLAARMVQEGSSTSGGEFEWEGQTYKGYYNFFNIGAYGSNPALRGLAYAAGLLNNTKYGIPWNSPQKAIDGGAMYLANGYITTGQNNLYLQKFNTNPNANSKLYTHQYMTNIMAPTSEASDVYYSYEEGNLLESSFNFLIPVYKNMTVTKQPSSLSNNNYLHSITVNSNSIPGFDEDILTYKFYVTNDITSVTINALAASENATISGTGTISLTGETTNLNVVVTAQNGTTRTYTISVIKVSDTSTVSDIISKLDVRLNGDILSGIKVDTNIVALNNSIKKTSPSATVTFRNSSGNIISEGILRTGDKVTIKTLANDEKTFIIAVNGDVSGDGAITILDLLKVQKHLLKSAVLTGANLTAADVNKDSVVNLVDLLKVQKYLLKEGEL